MGQEHLWITCSCMSEAMMITHYHETEASPCDEFYIAIYKDGNSKKPNLWRRLKYCWYHLTTGKKYEDQMILSPEKAKEISDWINNRLNKQS